MVLNHDLLLLSHQAASVLTHLLPMRGKTEYSRSFSADIKTPSYHDQQFRYD